jgi:polyhydroxybutyrate depolymerase
MGGIWDPVMQARRLVIRGLVGVAAAALAGALAGVAFLNGLNRFVIGVPRQTGASLVSSGRTREYLLHVPPTYVRGRPTPLVISLHGAALWPSTQMETSRWNDTADAQGFIAVYPSGVPIAPLPILPRLPVWRVESERGVEEDVLFLSDLIDRLEATYSVDPRRVYVDGFSNGGAMALVLSCHLETRIAAVGAVAAAQTLPMSWCGAPGPMPLIAFHGTADRFVPYGGPSFGFPGWTADWARRNHCDPKPMESGIATGVTRDEYMHCADGATVVRYTIQDGGHAWPGGRPLPRWMVGSTTTAIDATALMWEFFRRYERPTATR